jgi:ATP-dependent Lhr-like helicase
MTSYRTCFETTSVFHLLHPSIQEVLQDRFEVPSEAQQGTIPHILEGKNVLLIAPTGTGKTESAILPIFSKLIGQSDRQGISVLYITPLRALNRDMLDRLEWWGKQLAISIEVRHGDTTKHERRRQTLQPPDMLITTPETLQAILMGRRLRENLKSVKYVVIDEVHELADSKRGAQLALALERLNGVATDFQRIGLSATVGSSHEIAKFLVGTTRECTIVEVSASKMLEFSVTRPTVTEIDYAVARRKLVDPELASHVRLIRKIVDEHKSTLIFVNTRQAAEALGAMFRGTDIGVHHGSLSREARIEAENDFKSGTLKGLICTSSMELGIDIGDVEHVVQYMSPREVTRLLQRVGRAGHRIGELSRGTIIATYSDDELESWVITDMARRSDIEPVNVHNGAMDALANQLCFMALDGDISLNKALAIIRNAHPYRDVTLEALADIIKTLRDQRLLKVEIQGNKGTLRRRAKTRRYCYENLSMIPDEKRYVVYDTVNGKFVGALDESFVINFASPGAVFIMKGEMWRVLEIDENRIKAEPVETTTGEIPSWIGEQIPVPFEVATEVGRIREWLFNLIDDHEYAIGEIVARYQTDIMTANDVMRLIERHRGFPLPTDKRVVVESAGKSAVINVCFGHRVNETVGRVITSLLAARFGSSVAMEIDPYRIKLELPNVVSAKAIAQLINDVKPEFVEPLIEITLRNSMLLKWKIVHVARKFGVLERDVDYDRLNLSKLIDIYRDTPVYREAVREILHDKLDVRRARDVFKQVAAGEITVVTSKVSPIGSAGYSGARELLVPENADQSILQALKNRIMNDRVILFCVTCKKWKSKRTVGRVPEHPECPLCGSKLIAALKPWEDEEIVLLNKQEGIKTAEEKARTRRVYRNANLVLSHGKKGVIALASRGLGPEYASKVIRKSRLNEDGFYRDILKYERHYTATRRFWHD